MKRDIRTFRAACRLNGITGGDVYEFSAYLHKLKAEGTRGSGTNGDFTFEELGELASEFKGESDDH